MYSSVTPQRDVFKKRWQVLQNAESTAHGGQPGDVHAGGSGQLRVCKYQEDQSRQEDVKDVWRVDDQKVIAMRQGINLACTNTKKIYGLVSAND